MKNFFFPVVGLLFEDIWWVLDMLVQHHELGCSGFWASNTGSGSWQCSENRRRFVFPEPKRFGGVAR